MKKILGLDLGTNSIGWAIVNEAESDPEQSSIIKLGSRIIHFDNFVKSDTGASPYDAVKDFSAGKGLSPNAGRTKAHGMRIRLQRYKLRRKHLIKILKDNNIIKEDTLLCEDGKGTTLQTYRIRAKAATDEISLEEFARVLLMINKKRGYKSSRKEIIEDDAEESGFLGAISARSRQLTEQNLTVGQWKYNQLVNSPHKSLRDTIFYRQDYLDEFEKVWAVQSQYHAELTDELKETIRDIIIFYQRKLKSQKTAISFCPFESQQREIIVDGKKKLRSFGCRVIPKSSPLFQEFRILQNLNNVKVTDFVHHEERVLTAQEISALAAELAYSEKMSKAGAMRILKLKKTEYDLNFEELQGNRTMARLLKAFYKIKAKASGEIEKFEKMSATAKLEVLEPALEKLGINTAVLHFDSSLEGKAMEKQPAYHLWHLLYSYISDDSRSGNDKLLQKLEEQFGISKEYGNIIANIVFEADYGGLSSKAIKKILPFLKDCYTYDKACLQAGYNHSGSLTKEEMDNRELDDFLALIPRTSLRNPVVEKILNQMVNVVNQIILEYGKPDEVRIELARELKKTAKQRQQMTEAIGKSTKDHEKIAKLLQEEFHIARPTRNDIIRYKLYRELAKNGYKTLYSNTYIPIEELFSKNFDIEHIIPKARLFNDSFANKTLEARSVNKDKSDMTAYDFVLQAYGEEGMQSYKARVEELFKAKQISKAKRDFLLMEESKIPADFLNRDLAESQYIARQAREMLLKVVRTVTTTTGSITDRLREDWELVDIMKELSWDKYDRLGLTETYTDAEGRKIGKIKDWTKRNDHRHHAMDALTIAFTKPAFIQYLNNLNARSDKGGAIYGIQQKELENRKGKLRFKAPMEIKLFRQEAKKHLSAIFVSLKPKGKVATNSINLSGKQKTVTPRGQLHNETVYGRILQPVVKRGKVEYEEMFTIRKAIAPDLKIDKVIDKRIREILQQRLAEYGGDAKEAFSNLEENPIWLNREKGIAIKKVKVKGVNVAIPLHDKRDNKGTLLQGNDGEKIPSDFVSPNNNHHIAVFRDAEGNLHEHVVTFFEAVIRKNQNLEVIDKNFNYDKGWRFLFTMKINEYFVFPNPQAGFYPEDVNLKDEKYNAAISQNLFRVQKLSTKNYTFRHHLETNVQEEKALRDTTWKRLQNTNALQGVVKVRINHIGKIVQIGE